MGNVTMPSGEKMVDCFPEPSENDLNMIKTNLVIE